MIALYRAPYSTNCERVTIALAHKGLAGELESVWIDYADRSPVEAVSGQGLVPVIDHDGTVVADSLAILAHLERVAPEPALWPADPAAAAELDLFLDWFDRVWKVAPNAIEAQLRSDAPDREAVAAHAAAMDRHMEVFEAMLTGRDRREYLLGAFSAADCAAYPFLKYATGRPAGDPDLFHRILDEHLTVEDRPAVADWILRMGRRAGPADRPRPG